jgi:CBS domain-containing protein/sporulation protein YlmC with PRC-barrel domain
MDACSGARDGNLRSVSIPSRVFVSRLAGLTVLDPTGDQVGRLRDVVVALRVGTDSPRALGIVVEIQQRRTIFVPMGRITGIDAATAVLSSGTVSVRRFDKRPGESLAIADLFDRTVTLVEDGRSVTVVDLGMERNRARDWLITRVAVSEPMRRLRRRGPVQQVSWSEVRGLSLPQGPQGADNLLAVFDKLRPADLANVIHDLSNKRRVEVAAALDDDRLAEVLAELPEDDQIEIVTALTGERAADVLEAMGPDDAADILSELPKAEQEKLLELMQPEDAAPLRRLLTYDDYSAGGMMTPEPVILPPNATVADALARVRDPAVTPALASVVYVCRPPMTTPTGKYLGMAHVQRLLREPPSAPIAGVLDTDSEPLSPDSTLSAVTAYLATYNLVAVPVVDSDDHLLGAVSVDDVLDHLLPEGWRERGMTRTVGNGEE